MKYKIVIVLVFIETIIIIFLASNKYINRGGFAFYNTETSSPYSFSFVLSKLKDTYGGVHIENDGSLASVMVKDIRGRSIFVGFDEERIVSYVISDKGMDYEMKASFLEEYVSDNPTGKLIIVREEKLQSTEHFYYVDYNKPPYFFSDLPISIEPFEIDPPSP